MMEFYRPAMLVRFGARNSRLAPSWPIAVSALSVTTAIEEMIRDGFLSWRRCLTEADREGPFLTTSIPPEEIRVYDNYDCVTFEDHVERYGYGPHEFYITQRGAAEISRPEYVVFHDQASGS